MLIAVGVAAIAACGAGPDDFTDQRSWAPVPEEVPMPAAAPDDPAAYRGVRFRMAYGVGGASVEAGGAPVPWLSGSPGGFTAAGPVNVYFGSQQVFDGRRWMVWFFRLVEPPPPAPPPPQSAERTQIPPDPPMAVLDVLVLPPAGWWAEGRWGFERGCGPAFPTGWGPTTRDEVIIVGDHGWRLNRGTGRIEPTDPDDAACPDED